MIDEKEFLLVWKIVNMENEFITKRKKQLWTLPRTNKNGKLFLDEISMNNEIYLPLVKPNMGLKKKKILENRKCIKVIWILSVINNYICTGNISCNIGLAAVNISTNTDNLKCHTCVYC